MKKLVMLTTMLTMLFAFGITANAKEVDRLETENGSIYTIDDEPRVIGTANTGYMAVPAGWVVSYNVAAPDTIMAADVECHCFVYLDAGQHKNTIYQFCDNYRDSLAAEPDISNLSVYIENINGRDCTIATFNDAYITHLGTAGLSKTVTAYPTDTLKNKRGYECLPGYEATVEAILATYVY